ncbi:Do family serine endopeptidase [candidate division WOR-3 bacterium]|nr:Do family serine endopeptidase [candidate division WOR-3 bacterium]
MKRVLQLVALLLIPFVVGNAAVPADGFSEVVDKISPSVVEISVLKKVAQSYNYDFNFDEDERPEDLRKYFKFWGLPDIPEVPEPTPVLGSGTGLIYDTKGLIVTNNHVVEDAEEITVKLSDGTEYTDVEVVGRDPETDLAVIRIKPKGTLASARFADSDAVKVGDWAIALGNPYNLEYTLTVGVVSAKGRNRVGIYGGPSFQDFIQTDAAINPGNSGGPLCNTNGEVIGINTAIRTAGLANSGIGFAIPSNMAKKIVTILIEKGKISRGYLGIFLEEADPDVLDAMGINQTGIFVTKVVPETPAEKAGLADGDFITSFAGEEVTSVEQFRWLVASTEPGTSVKMNFIRDGQNKQVNLKLAERPAPEEMTESGITPEKEPEETAEFVLGIKARNLTDSEKESYGVKSGVYVKEVKPASIASKAGVLTGDVILKVNKKTVSDVSELKRLKGDLEKADIILFQINRRGHTHFLTIRP